MKRHDPELMSALLDGELRGLRRLLVLRHARKCPVCAAEYRQLRHVRRMLRSNPPAVQMSDSPGFFWSKVKREIESQGAGLADSPVPRLSISDWLLVHQGATAAVAAVVVAALVAAWAFQSRNRAPEIAGTHQPESPVQIMVVQTTEEQPIEAPSLTIEQFTKVEQVSTAIPNTVATVVDTDDSDVAVIWISGLPWTQDITDMKTQYANLDT